MDPNTNLSNRLTLYKYFPLRDLVRFAATLHYGLYAALPDQLNDPMEGHWFSPSGPRDLQVSKRRALKEQRVCCFSKIPHSTLMWAHYADQFAGACLEVELDKFAGQILQATEVVYSEVPHAEFDSTQTPDEYARYCLSRKSKEWSYEEEVRLFWDAPIIGTPPVYLRRILLGPRTQPEVRRVVRACTPIEVDVLTTRLCKTGKVEARDLVQTAPNER